MHARARDRFVHVKQIFALAEAINQDVHRTAIKAMAAQPQQVVEQARDFGKHHPDVLGPLGHFQAHHLFNRQAVRVLVAHHGDVIKAIHVGQRLDVGFALGQFFCGTVQQANVRIRTLNHLAIELQHQAQHTVGRGVLRAEIQCVIFDVSHGSMRSAVLLFSDDAWRDFPRLNAHRLVNHPFLLGVITHFHMARGREVFAEWVANEAIVGEQAAQIFVAVKDNAKKIKGLALEPIGRTPNGVDRIHPGHVIVHRVDTQSQAPVVRQGQQMANHCVTGAIGVATVGTVFVGRVIQATQVDELLKSQAGVIAQSLRD